MDSFKSSADITRISLTVKALAASLIPVFHLVFGVTVVSEDVDRVIDAIFLLITTGMAFYGYLRSKRILGDQLKALNARR